jgi:hypothetical protein
LRAEFAMSTRRLEMSVEQMKAKTTSQLAEIGKKSEAVGRLKLDLGEKTASLFALEAKERQLIEELQLRDEELVVKASEASEIEQKLADTAAELATMTADYNEAALASDSQRIELVALRAQAEVFKADIESFEHETKELKERITHDTAAAEATSQLLNEERGTTEALATRVSELERQLLAQTTEGEILTRRVEELMGRLDEQGRFLAEREYASDQLRTQALAAKKVEADVRLELAETEKSRKLAIEGLNVEKAQLEDQLRASHDERARLLREIELMKREAENAWAAERMENAVMRERINDVAAEVARLTSALEGPGSPIDAILASDMVGRPMAPANGNGHGGGRFAAIPAAHGETKGTLADRIRALQGRASRVPQASTA